MAYTKQERQEYDHHYYLVHREVRLAQNKVWYSENKDKVYARRKRYYKRYYAEHRDEILKKMREKYYLKKEK